MKMKQKKHLPEGRCFLIGAAGACLAGLYLNKSKRPILSDGSFLLERVTRLELASAPHKSFAFVGAPHLMDLKERGYTAFLGGGIEFGPWGTGESKRPILSDGSFSLERVTRLELATSTLARWRSTR